jgi:hypothetical protein
MKRVWRWTPGSFPVMAQPAQGQLEMGPVRGLVLRKRRASCRNRLESQLHMGTDLQFATLVGSDFDAAENRR